MGRAENYDPNLKNPWGIALAVHSPFWISNQASDTATLYDGAGNTIPLVVGIPPVGFPTGPTGQAFKSSSSFNLPDGSPAHFLFDTLDGRILGWNGGATAVTVATVAGAGYTGLAIASSGGANYIYATTTPVISRCSIRASTMSRARHSLGTRPERGAWIPSFQHSEHWRQFVRDVRGGKCARGWIARRICGRVQQQRNVPGENRDRRRSVEFC
jgi:hypothetical protein